MMKLNGFKLNDTNKGCLTVIIVCVLIWSAAVVWLLFFL